MTQATMFTASTSFEKRAGVVERRVAGETVVVPVYDNVASLTALYSLDGVGLRIWELLEDRPTAVQIAKTVAAEYDIGVDLALTDTLRFLAELGAVGLIRQVGTGDRS